MYLGFKAYNRVQEGWSKVKTLFTIQIGVVIYLIWHELNSRSIPGYFLILSLTAYMQFLTLSVIIDSMVDNETAARTGGIHTKNLVFRVFMHLGFVALFIVSFQITGCSVNLFPPQFIFVALYTLANAAFALYLYYIWNEDSENFLFNRFAAIETKDDVPGKFHLV